MRRSSGMAVFVRLCACVAVVMVALGYYGHVKAQGGSSTGTVVIPLRPLAPLSSVPIPPVFGLEGIVADKTSAIQLGKALFWDMQAGRDDIQACASCHFNAGADSRINNDVNPGQPGGDTTFQIGVPLNGVIGPNHTYSAGTAGAGFGGYHDGDFPFRKLADVNDRFSVISDVNDISGSAGVFPMKMGQIMVGTLDNKGNVQPSNPDNSGASPVQGGSDDNGNDGAGLTRSPGGVGNPNRKIKSPVINNSGPGSSNG